MLSKSLLEADGFLETTGYIFHDKGIDLITGHKRTIPIYTQIDDIDLNFFFYKKNIKINEKKLSSYLIKLSFFLFLLLPYFYFV